MQLVWEKFTYDTLEDAKRQCFCLYVFHHPQDGDRPFYIGKAKSFGTSQSSGYTASARYNSGYMHLIAGMLRSDFSLYIAHIGEAAFKDVEAYEQELIYQWGSVRKQKIKPNRKSVTTVKPWATSDSLLNAMPKSDMP
ncbi:hypothetical protein ABH905_000923 [Pseudomonas frederiksbergensis]|uniref:hypothetical protein n=1 Tax=Pseudomonas frederiksbergensis TaxID=104087 RepID=UPI003D1E64A7